MLPTILFEVCQYVKIWFLFDDFVLVFDSFLQDRSNEPVLPVGRISPLFVDSSILFWRNGKFVRVFSKDDSWILTV